ncbi:MAG TPA: discoidin domain-containing protein, partial [Bacillales bacterium]|nr:discoidin domain-containing protein [Bacillales bacterium]
MMKYNRLLFASIVLMLIFAMPGMTNLITQIYAASSVSELLDSYLDVLPIVGDATSSSEPAPSPSPQSTRSASLAADPTAGCSESKIVRIGASGHDGSTVPQNTVDKNYNTRWSNHGKGSFIQYELEPNKIICAIDIAFYRGDVRTYDFTVSASNDG